MSIVDLVILIPLIYGAYTGYKQGLVMMIVSILAFYISLLLGLKFYQIVLEAIAPHLNVSDGILPIIAFVITFGVILFFVFWLGKKMRKFLKSTMMGVFDNILGAILGMLKIGVILSLLLWLVNSVNILKQETIAESTLYPYIEPIAPYIVSNSSKILMAGQDVLEQIKNTINHSGQPNP